MTAATFPQADVERQQVMLQPMMFPSASFLCSTFRVVDSQLPARSVSPQALALSMIRVGELQKVAVAA